MLFGFLRGRKKKRMQVVAEAVPVGNWQGLQQLEPRLLLSGTAVPSMLLAANAVSENGSYNAAVSMTFTSSVVTSDFTVSDISVSNAVVSGFAGSDDIYTATITPDSDGVVSVQVASVVFSDASMICNKYL